MRQIRVAKPKIFEAFRPDQHVVIEASAGTGKTYTLERLVLDRVLAGVKISEILVVTFTEKAASEMRGRIRQLLASTLALCRGAEGRDVEEAGPNEPCWILDEVAEGYLDAALRTFDSAQISTIHAFCQRILGEQAFANQRLFSESTADARTLFSTAFREALRSDFFQGEAAEVFEFWLRQGGSIEKLERLLYGCASERARRMPACDTSAVDEILSLFPLDDDVPEELERAWKTVGSRQRHGPLVDRYRKIRERMEELPADDGEGAFFQRLRVAWSIQAGAASSTPWVRTVRERLEQIVDRSERLERLLAFCVRIEEELPSLEALAVDRLLPPVAERLQARKRREGLLTFDDMLVALDRSLRGPEGEALTALLRERFRYGLIDEFQDTDEVQWSIFRRIFFDSGGTNLLYAIGDPKQAIYQFRGADVQTYLEAKDAILAGGGAHVVLEACFRSSPALIEGINHILDPAGRFFSGEVGAQPVSAGRKELRAVAPDGSEVPPIQVLRIGADEGPPLEALAERIADEIHGFIRADAPTFLWDEGEGPRRLSHRDVYVLYRSTREGRTLSRVLRRRGIPFAFYKEEGLFQREEAWAWFDLLRAVASPDDPLLRTRAWLSPFFAVPLEEVGKLRDLPSHHPFLERLTSWALLAEERRYEQLFSTILDESAVLRRSIVDDDERELTNLLHLSELLLARANRQRCSLHELTRWLKAMIDGRAVPEEEGGNQQRLETERQAVQLMTLHASKGLEAPVVFLAGGIRLSPTQIPLALYHEGRERRVWVGKPPGRVRELVRSEARQEDERLLYVGMTRAKARLYLPLYEGTVNGSYQPLQERLERLCDEMEAGGLVADSPLHRIAVAAGRAPAPPRPEPLLGREEPEDARGEEPQWGEEAYAALREARLGFLTTSYTRMRGFRATEEWEEERVEGEQVVAPPGPDELPGGAATGIFLHEVLARLEPGSVPDDFEAFRARPEVQRIFEEEGRRHGIHGPHLEHAWRLVHGALIAPVPLEEGATMARGVRSAARWLAEMEFLFPLPEDGHPPLGAPPDAHGFTIGRGFVKGFIDLTFEQGGRVYFADWKSDCLPSFDPSYVDRYVERSYEIQARLYTLAVAKLMGWSDEAAYERGFGGLYYFFLRGMEPGSTRGIYRRRPSWRELLSWEAWLRREAKA